MQVRDRRVSWSMMALLLSLAGALLIGLVAWVPPLIGKDSGVRAITPGLLTVAPDAAGTITLGEGRAVTLDPTGMRVTHGDDVLLRTVRSGSPVSALVGSLSEDSRREELDGALSDLTVERVGVSGGAARYEGHVSGDGQRLPLTLTVTFDDDWVRVLVDVRGADAVVVHSAEEQDTLGVTPALPGRRLRKKAWWVPSGIGRDTEALVTALGTALAVGPSDTVRAVDLRRPGHMDLHVWAEQADISVTSSARYKRADRP